MSSKWCLNLNLNISSQSSCEILDGAIYFEFSPSFTPFRLAGSGSTEVLREQCVAFTASLILQNQQVNEILPDTGSFQGKDKHPVMIKTSKWQDLLARHLPCDEEAQKSIQKL